MARICRSSRPLLVVDQRSDYVALSEHDKCSEKDNQEHHWHKPNFLSLQHELPKLGQKRHRSSLWRQIFYPFEFRNAYQPKIVTSTRWTERSPQDGRPDSQHCGTMPTSVHGRAL